MSAREWVPGDVASPLQTGTQPALRTTAGWTYIDGSNVGSEADEYGFRPLIVVDPEDPDLPIAHAIFEALDSCGTRDFRVQRERIRAALREFANPTPPKPDEPQGLGAVVATEADGDWIRVSVELINPWLNVQTGSQRHWDAVAAIRVLSEGVTE